MRRQRGQSTVTFLFLVLWPVLVVGAAAWLARAHQTETLHAALSERPALLVIDENAMIQAKVAASPGLAVADAHREVRQTAQALAAQGYVVIDVRLLSGAPAGLVIRQ
jgi:hypothetical protein